MNHIAYSYCTDWTIQLFGSSVIRTWKTYMFNKIIFKRRTLGRFKISIDCDLLKSVINKCIRLFIVLKCSNSFKVMQLVSSAVTRGNIYVSTFRIERKNPSAYFPVIIPTPWTCHRARCVIWISKDTKMLSSQMTHFQMVSLSIGVGATCTTYDYRQDPE